MALDLTYLQANNGSAEAALMHVSSPRSPGATTIDVDTVSGVPAKFIATYGTLNAQGFIDPASAVNFYGHKSGSDLEIDGILAGSVDAGNDVGDVVVIRPSGFAENLIGSALTSIMNDAGTLLSVDSITEKTPAAGVTIDSVLLKDGLVDGYDLSDFLQTGWIPANATWTYASATTITVPSGATSIYSIGDPIGLFQNSLQKYFYVVGVANTVLTLSPGITSAGAATTLTNHAITLNKYAKGGNPNGFLPWIPYTPEWKGSSGDPAIVNGTITGWFKMDGREVHAQIFIAMGSSTTYGSGEYVFGLPVLPKTGSGFGITPPGAAFFIDSSANASYIGLPYVQDSTASSPYTSRMSVLFSSATTTGLVTAISTAIPFTFAVSDQIRISARYRADG